MYFRTTTEFRLRAEGLTSRIALAGLLALASPAAASPECKQYATASYQATRTVEISGKTITGTVYISGDNERDETIGPDGKPAVHIKSPQQIITYSPDTKTGIMLPTPPGKAESRPKSDATTQVERKTEGALHTTTIKKKIGDAWFQVYRSVCRNDGVLMERDFPVPLGRDKNAKMGTGKMRHTAIELKAITASSFEVPSDVRIMKPGPAKTDKK